jgi:hypothetical protein
MRPQSTLRKKRFSRPRGVKAMHADGLDWGEVGRPLGRASLGRESSRPRWRRRPIAIWGKAARCNGVSAVEPPNLAKSHRGEQRARSSLNRPCREGQSLRPA